MNGLALAGSIYLGLLALILAPAVFFGLQELHLRSQGACVYEGEWFRSSSADGAEYSQVLPGECSPSVETRLPSGRVLPADSGAQWSQPDLPAPVTPVLVVVLGGGALLVTVSVMAVVTMQSW